MTSCYEEFINKFIDKVKAGEQSFNASSPSMSASQISQHSGSVKKFFSQFALNRKKLRNLLNCGEQLCAGDGGKVTVEFIECWLEQAHITDNALADRRDMLEYAIDLLYAEKMERQFEIRVLKAIHKEIRSLDRETLEFLCSKYVKYFAEGKSKGNRWIDVLSALVQKLEHVKEMTWKGDVLSGKNVQALVLEEILSSGSEYVTLQNALCIVRECGDVGDERRSINVRNLCEKLSCHTEVEEVQSAALKALAMISRDECTGTIDVICAKFESLELDTIGDMNIANQREEANSHINSQKDKVSNERRRLFSAQLAVILAIHDLTQRHVDYAKIIFSHIIKTKKIACLKSVFSVALLVSLSQVNRLHSTALIDLKSVTKKLMKEIEEIDTCFWLKMKLQKYSRQKLTDFKAVLTLLIDVGNGDTLTTDKKLQWKLVICGGLIGFGFLLLDTNVKMLPLTKGRISHCDETASNALPALGAFLLFQSFQNGDESLWTAILERLLNEICAHNQRLQAWYLIDLLATIVSTCPMQVIVCRSLVLEMLRNIKLFSSFTAIPLFATLMPIIVKNRELRQTLMSVLKNLLLSSSADHLKSAIGGFLIFLRNYKASSAILQQKRSADEMLLDQTLFSQSFPTFSSQLARDVSNAVRAQCGGEGLTNYDALCLEAIGCLKRCFSQPSQARSHLYKGLVDLALKNRMLVEPAVDMLMTQLSVFITPIDKPNPFVVDRAVVLIRENMTCRTEPLGDLLRALHRCLWALTEAEISQRLTSTQQDESATVLLQQSPVEEGGGGGEKRERLIVVDDKLLKRLDSMTGRLAVTDMEDLELDKSTDFGAGSGTGLRNAHYAAAVLSVYEALIEHCWWFINPFKSEESAERLLALFTKRNKLLDVLREKNVALNHLDRKETTAFEGKKNRDGGSRTAKSDKIGDRTQLMVNTLKDMLSKLCCDKQEQHATGLALIRKEMKFFGWVIGAVGDKIDRWTVAATRKQVDREDKEAKLFDNFNCLAGILLMFYIGQSTKLAEEVTGPKVELAWKTTAIAAYANLLTYFINTYSRDRIKEALTEILYSVSEDNPNDSKISESSFEGILLRYFNMMRKTLESYLEFAQKAENKQSKHHLSKQCTTLISILSTLASMIPPSDNNRYDEMIRLIDRILKTKTIYDISVAREMWKLSGQLQLNRDWTEEWLLTVTDAAAHILHAMSADENTDISNNDFKSINLKTGPTVLLELIRVTEKTLKLSRTLIERLPRASASADKAAKYLCSLLDQVANCVRMLLKVSLRYCMHKESMVILMTGFYETLNQLAEFYLACTKIKTNDVSNWSSLADLTMLVQGSALKVMEDTDKNINLEDKNDEEMGHSRKFNKALRDCNIYSKYNRIREQYECAMVMLSNAVDDPSLHVKVKNYSIGLVDFKIDRAKMEECLRKNNQSEEEKEEEEEENVPAVRVTGKGPKRRRMRR